MQSRTSVPREEAGETRWTDLHVRRNGIRHDPRIRIRVDDPDGGHLHARAFPDQAEVLGRVEDDY